MANNKILEHGHIKQYTPSVHPSVPYQLLTQEQKTIQYSDFDKRLSTGGVTDRAVLR